MDSEKYIQAAELLGGFLLKWVVSKMLGTSPTPQIPAEPKQTRKAVVSDDDPALKNTSFVLAFASIRDLETVHKYRWAGYFPHPVDGPPYVWRMSDLYDWQAWRDDQDSRETFTTWKASGEPGFHGDTK